MDKPIYRMMVLSVGANSGDREESVRKALEWLTSILLSPAVSTVYETPPLGHTGANYMNAVVAGCFPQPAHALQKLCKDYELENGRDQKARERGEVPIDIDVVMCDSEILRPKDYRSNFFRIGYDQLM